MVRIAARKDEVQIAKRLEVSQYKQNKIRKKII
jgi:hypothetical protein